MVRQRVVQLAWILAATTLTHVARSDEPSSDQPNIVLFLADDLGWGDLACYGHPEIKTPHLDAFAAEGVRFTQCYSACGVCSPSRAALLTGRTPYRNGVWRWIPGNHELFLKKSEITIAELLQEAGYQTCHAGKWHLNGKFNSPDQPQPHDHGYDHWLATQNNAQPNHLNPVNYVRNGQPTGRIEGPSAVIAATEAITWLRRRTNTNEPFFITVWTHEPHLPIESDPRFMAPYQHLPDEALRQHHGNVTQLDHAFGLLIEALDELGQTDSTFILFTSDNGPEGNGLRGRTRGSTGGLRGENAHDYEGGIRVPGIVRFPRYFRQHQISAGSTSDVPIVGSDALPTVCALSNVPVPTDRVIDGASLLPALAGQPVIREQPLYWRTHISPVDCRVALRDGNWKIVADASMQKFQLFDMAQDAQETHNLAEEHPETFDKLKQRLIAFDREVRADGGTLDVQEGAQKRKQKPKRLPE